MKEKTVEVKSMQNTENMKTERRQVPDSVKFNEELPNTTSSIEPKPISY